MSEPHTADLGTRYRYRQEGAEAERERIVKLLSNPLHHNIQSPDIHKDCYTCVLVALIKGDNK